MDLRAGFGLFLLSAIFNGVLAWPLRVRRRFAVENTWTCGNLFGMIICPLVLAPLVLPAWKSALGAAGRGALVKLVAFGFGWGTGSVAYSLGVAAVGLGVGIATILGVLVAVGAGIPLLRRWAEIPPAALLIVLAGIAIAIIGVAVVGWAGLKREREAKAGGAGSSVEPGVVPRTDTSRRAYVIGLRWCIFSGLASACSNIGFDLAAPVGKAAVVFGANPIFASLFRWIPLFVGGYLAVLVFSGSTLVRKHTWRNFYGPGAGHDFALAMFLGLGMFAAPVTYGMGAVCLGELGTSMGYAVAICMGLICANLMGFVTGEWKGAPPASLKTLFAGLGILIFAIVLLAASQRALS